MKQHRFDKDFQKIMEASLETYYGTSEEIVESEILQEKHSVNKAYDKHGVTFTYGRGNYPNGLLGVDSHGNYYTLLFKTQKKITPWLKLPDNITSVREVMYYYHDLAVRNKVGIKKWETEMSGAEFFNLLVVKESINKEWLTRKFPDLNNLKLENSLKAGDFDIIYMDEKSGKQIADLFTSVCSTLSKTGFGQVCYGEVISTMNMGKVLADYTIASDSIRVTNKARKSADAIHTVIHELGHRLYHKFMGPSDHKKIKEKYYNTRNSVDSDSDNIEVGQIVDFPGVGELEIFASEYSRGKIMYKMKKLGSVDRQDLYNDAVKYVKENGTKPENLVELIKNYFIIIFSTSGKKRLANKNAKIEDIASELLRRMDIGFDLMQAPDNVKKDVMKVKAEASDLVKNSTGTYSAPATKIAPYVKGLKGDKDPFNVSSYAMTDHEEFFSEVFAEAHVKKDPILVKWISQFK